MLRPVFLKPRIKHWFFLPIVWVVLAGASSCGGEEDNFPALAPFPPELAERVQQIRDRVSAIRELPPHERIVEGFLTTEQLQAYSSAQTATRSQEEQADLEAYDIALTTLGLIGEEQDLQQLVSEEYTGLIGGLYFYKENRLVLVGDNEIGLQDELVLAHEYTHSLQDGRFELDKLTRDWAQSDLEKDGFAQYSETLTCLIEGDATYTARLYAEQVFGPDWRQKVEDESAKGAVGEEPELPEFLARAVSFNYGDCAAFVEGLHKQGGWQAVNAAFERPPATTEQILHLDKYKSHQVANTVPPRDLSEDLGQGWKRLDSAQFGEFDVFNYAVTLSRDPGAAVVAAAGWGAGWINVYRSQDDPTRVFVQLFLSWDSDQDFVEFLLTYDAMIQALGGQVTPLDERRAQWSSERQFGRIVRHANLAAAEITIARDQETLGLLAD
jgi:hypothetical protein